MDKFHQELETKFKGCLPLKTLQKNFSLGELTKLSEMEIDLEEIKAIKHQYEKVIKLKSKLISIDDILKIAKEIITKEGFCQLKELDSELQKVYIVNARTKTIYLNFLIELFRNNLFKEKDIQYVERKKIGKKDFRHIISFIL